MKNGAALFKRFLLNMVTYFFVECRSIEKFEKQSKKVEMAEYLKNELLNSVSFFEQFKRF